MARKKQNKTTEEKIRENMAIDQKSYIEKLKKDGFFHAPKEKSQTARLAFSDFWAQHQSKFKKGRDLEEILWAHLKAIKHDVPELFVAGCRHFGIFKD